MKKLFIITLFFAIQLTYSQTIKVEGTVKDSIGNPLELANIIAFVKGSTKVEAYSITNDKGEFRLVLPTNATYSFRVSYIGFETQTAELEIPDNSGDLTNKNFTLKEEDNTLSEVELTFEMPVTIKGDTIVYNSDSFTNGTEKKLEDILKKLPGVEINDQGEIEVEGKVVNKVMVEGKDFFDGDSKIASQNIPANAVDKIEVLRNYNEVGPMRGMGDDSDNIAINIKLKEGKKNFWFGEITAGVGTEEWYLVHPKLFYYSPKTSINIITDLNNVGEIPFTRQDYYRFSGGFRNLMRRGGTNFNVSGGLGFSALQNNMATDILSKFAAVNISHSPKESLTISGFSIFNESDVDMFEQTATRNIVTNNLELRESTTQQKSQLGMLKMSVNYIPDANTHFDYDVFMKKSKQTENGFVESVVNGVGEEIIDEQKQSPSSINQNLNYYKVLNEKNVFSVEMQHLYQEENPLLNFLRDSQPFDNIIPTQPETIYDLSQQKDVRTNKFDSKVDYYYVLNNKSNLNFTLGSTFSHQNFDSNMFQILDNGSQLNFNEDDLFNDVKYQFNDVYLGLHYKVVTGKFTFTPGFTMHSYKTKDTQLGVSNSNSDFNIVPDLLIQWKLKQSQNLRFNYSMVRDYTDINKLSEGYILNNFNSLFEGNRNLESALYNRFNLSFFSFSMFNFTNMNASITYSKKTDDIKNISDFTGFNQTISAPYNSNLADETLSGRARYGRRFGKFKVNANMSLNYSKFNGIVNNSPNVSESFTQNYTASFATNFKTAPNLEIGYTKTFNQYDSSSRSSDFTTDKPFAKLDIVFLKSFSFIADYSYYNYSDGTNTIENTYSFLDASLYYQQSDSKWEFVLSGKNLTDTKSINRDSFNETYTTATSYYVMPLRLLFSIKYNL